MAAGHGRGEAGGAGRRAGERRRGRGPARPTPMPRLPPTAVAERTDCAAASQLRRPPTANRPTARRIAAGSPAEPSPPSARHPPNACHASCQAPATSAHLGCPTGPPSEPPAQPPADHNPTEPTLASSPPRPLPARPLRDRRAACQPPAGHRATDTAACAELMLSVRSH